MEYVDFFEAATIASFEFVETVLAAVNATPAHCVIVAFQIDFNCAVQSRTSTMCRGCCCFVLHCASRTARCARPAPPEKRMVFEARQDVEDSQVVRSTDLEFELL